MVVKTAQLLFFGWFLNLFPGEGAGRSPGAQEVKRCSCTASTKRLAAKGTGSRSCTEEWLSHSCNFKDRLQLEGVTTHPSLTWWFDFHGPKSAKSQLEMEVGDMNTLSRQRGGCVGCVCQWWSQGCSEETLSWCQTLPSSAEWDSFHR